MAEILFGVVIALMISVIVNIALFAWAAFAKKEIARLKEEGK